MRYLLAMSNAVQDFRRRRLVELRDGPFEGNATALGEFLGYKDGAFVRQMISGRREITEKTIAKIAAHHEYRRWFAATPNVERPASGGRVPLISWVAAGDWCNVENPYAIGDAEDWLICPIKHGPRTYALRGGFFTSVYKCRSIRYCHEA